MSISNLMGGGINRRRFMNCKDKCPYQRVEYLESGEQGNPTVIETDFVPNNNDIDIIVEFMLIGFTQPSSYSAMFGAFSDNARRAYRLFRNYTGLEVVLQLDGIGLITTELAKGEFTTLKLNPNEKYKIEMYHTGKYVLNKQEGILKMGHNDGLDNTQALCIFNVSPNTNGIIGRIYSLKAYKAGVRKLDLIPVRIGSEGFMYDRVSGKLFGNSGSGKFILGPDIN